MARRRRRKLDAQDVTRPAEVTTSSAVSGLASVPNPPINIPRWCWLVQLLTIALTFAAWSAVRVSVVESQASEFGRSIAEESYYRLAVRYSACLQRENTSLAQSLDARLRAEQLWQQNLALALLLERGGYLLTTVHGDQFTFAHRDGSFMVSTGGIIEHTNPHGVVVSVKKAVASDFKMIKMSELIRSKPGPFPP